MGLNLSIACDERDLNRAILNGDVEPDGVDATTVSIGPSNRHRRFFRHQEFDVCEVSLASYLSSRAYPDQYEFTAIPAFPNKRFRHSFFYKHADADVDGPADLAGKKVGISSWQTTANVWMRGISREHYGLDLDSVQWYRRKQDDVPISIPDRFDIQPVPGEYGGEAVGKRDDIRQALFDGTLDAVMDPSGTLFRNVAHSEDAEFMFDDPLREEQEYFAESGIHPPMHAVAILDDVLEEHPWVARNVFEAFCESRDRCVESGRNSPSPTSITWAHLHLLEQERAIGPDTWTYGLTDQTRREVGKFVEYAHNQGLIPRQYEVEELFVDSTI